MERARRHQRLLAALAFGILALAAELLGASLTNRFDLGRHVRSPSYSHAAYYPAVLAAVKVGIALLLASLLWRMLRARRNRAGRPARHRHVMTCRACGSTLSPRLWLAFFAVTATTYLVHMDTARLAGGRWALFFPWIHSSALPVFAVLSVLLAMLWSAVQRWLADYEQYAENAASDGPAPRPCRAGRHQLPADRPRDAAPTPLRPRLR